jgi:rhodanese-related sulfurtransferase
LIRELAPAELAQWRGDSARAAPLLLDVREPWEFQVCRIEGSVSVPLVQLQARLTDLPLDRPVVAVCHHGHRSYRAASWLQRVGVAEVWNLRGGVAAWAAEVGPRMPTY